MVEEILIWDVLKDYNMIGSIETQMWMHSLQLGELEEILFTEGLFLVE